MSNAGTPPPAASRPSTSTNTREDVLNFLESLDSYSASAPGTAPGKVPAKGPSGKPADPKDAQSVLDFLDEISQRSNTTTPKKDIIASVASASAGGRASPSPLTHQKSSSSLRNATPAPIPPPEKTPVPSPGNTPPEQAWSWGGIWKSASAAVQSAQTVVDSQVKQHLGTTDPRKILEERMKSVMSKEQLDKLSADLKKMSTSILNAVAPPIAEHEVIQVWLSHDMVGYVGIETLVYRSFAKILEQIEGGDLVVKSGKEERHKETYDEQRELNACEGFIQASKLAKANIEQQIKIHHVPRTQEPEKKSENPHEENVLPVTTCHVYMSIQPCKAAVPGVSLEENAPSTHLFFILALNDPENKIEMTLPTQPLPLAWLDIPFEDNEWVEDTMIDVLKLACTNLAMEYMWKRGRYMQTGNSDENKLHLTSLPPTQQEQATTEEEKEKAVSEKVAEASART